MSNMHPKTNDLPTIVCARQSLRQDVRDIVQPQTVQTSNCETLTSSRVRSGRPLVATTTPPLILHKVIIKSGLLLTLWKVTQKQ
ncbi:uncharacterized protein BO88DRAFT_84666 [Aspergillus vadensis CBS 113365]|uniref:Uncharacterized protein n=1 Tax=Aspergillus vadensis (strain CBS 113365 / IMI 142717 / IBT 24658) TaxID=1448311 RepID=A0A319B5U3_ASPVC|nr:hypothetical protein BO88DRAFT_84666 [Aspergillus vadensis CBS 113365]PYH67174.1 hypothetical protein BO88DRAFT_84666 [Aspergillus vadensis CBS 113365]